MPNQNHICGQCEKSFKSEQSYLDHECRETGYTPTEPEHQGEDFAAVSAAAVARGEAKKGKKARK